MWEKNKRTVVLSFIIVCVMGIVVFLILHTKLINDNGDNSQVMSADFSTQGESGAYQEDNDLNRQQAEEEVSNEEALAADYTKSVYFQQEDVAVVPEVQEYSFEDAIQKGEVWEIDGRFPATGTGTWYIVEIDGVEYYYGKHDTVNPENYYYERYILYGWSIVDDSYKLANGIKVGMNESDILEQYPNMAVIDFEDNFIYGGVGAAMGWNGWVYPNSDVGDDDDWDYKGKDYHWTDQFDYIMVAEIDLNGVDTLPVYLGLLIKDNVVAAVTFYCPTAG